MEAVYDKGIQIISGLQNTIGTSPVTASFFQNFHEISSPDFLLKFLVPLLFIARPWLAFRVAAAVGYANTVCIILKWSLQGERPFWWYQLNKDERNLTKFGFQQLGSTCEATHGNPSCHTLVVSSVACVLVTYGIWSLRKQKIRNITFTLLTAASISFLGLTAITRLYLGTHYMYQLTFGAVGGLIGGLITAGMPWKHSRLIQHFAAVIFFNGWHLLTVYTHQALGGNPHREMSSDLCPLRVISTMQWVEMSRDSGIIIGLGLLIGQYRSKIEPSFFQRLLNSVICIGIVITSNGTTDEIVGAFVTNLLVTLVVLGVVPFVMSDFHTKRKKVVKPRIKF